MAKRNSDGFTQAAPPPADDEEMEPERGPLHARPRQAVPSRGPLPPAAAESDPLLRVAVAAAGAHDVDEVLLLAVEEEIGRAHV